MKTKKLNVEELRKLQDAIDLAYEVRQRMMVMEEKSAYEETDINNIWELKNRAGGIGAILYNIHGGVYR